MTQYALYINEHTIKYPPKTFKSADKSFICFNFDKSSPEAFANQGFYPLIETNTREDVEDDTHCARPTYSLGDKQILCTYIAEEIQEDIGE